MSRKNESITHIIMTAVACNDVATVENMCAEAPVSSLGGALRFAVFKRHNLGIVRALGAELSQRNCEGELAGALMMALQRNYIEAFDVLMEFASPSTNYRECLHEAVMCGYTMCVQKILPRCDISSFGQQLLAQASYNKHNAMVDLLYPHCNAQQALEFLENEKVADDRKQLLIERMDRERLRQTLEDAVENTTHHSGARKI